MRRETIRLDEISVRGICTDLVRNLLYIFLAAAAMWLGATGVGSLTYTPEYTSSATVVVSEKGSGSAYSSLAVTNEMAGVFSEVFQSDALREKILEDTGEEIRGSISCASIEETNLLVLNAVSPDPRQAFLFINSALENYEQVAQDVFSNASLQILQEPQVPSSPSNTSWIMARRNLLAAAGMLAMAAVICLFYLLRFTVKSPSSASRLLDGTVRGIIPFESKGILGRKNTKKALLLNSPLVSMDFAEASRRAEAKVEYHMRRNDQKILLVTSISENEGKSTVAANIALALAEKHQKVLLVDGDLRQPAQYKVFEEKSAGRTSVEQVFTGKASWKENLYYNKAAGIWELFQFSGAKDPAAVFAEAPMKTLAREWKQEMDYIIIDCPPTAVSTDAEVWMEAADTVLLVVREDWSDVRIVNDTVDMIWQSGCDFSGFILNAFHRDWISQSSGYGYDYGDYGKNIRRGDQRG